MAVIGSGPAGFYTSYKVLSLIEGAKIDMYESLPVPFGLVRFGVAPDHPEVKHCQEKFSSVAESPQFRFVGNIEIGKGLSLQDLRDNYDAILFAYGASQDKMLGIPGEDLLRGIYSARHFVGWYNGLPEHASLQPDLSKGETAVVIGQGNVALDVARILLTDIDILRKTDITEHALTVLAESRIKRVNVVGRRGPMQAAFTIKEVRELAQLPGVSFDPIDESLLPPSGMKLSRTPKRLVNLLQQGSRSNSLSQEKSFSFKFLRSPVEFIGRSSQLNAIKFQENQYSTPNESFDSSAKVSPKSGQSTIESASLAFRSIGYRSVPIEGMGDLGIEFDRALGIVANDSFGRATHVPSAGQSVAHARDILPGLYCAGWVKRGPAGVIANTMEDAFATAEAIASDWQQQRPFLNGGNGWDTLSHKAAMKNVQPVSWSDWLAIDAIEKSRGKAQGKEREKFTSIPHMLDIVGQSP